MFPLNKLVAASLQVSWEDWMKSETSTKFYLIKCKPNDIQYWKPTRKYGRSQCKYGSMVLHISIQNLSDRATSLHRVRETFSGEVSWHCFIYSLEEKAGFSFNLAQISLVKTNCQTRTIFMLRDHFRFLSINLNFADIMGFRLKNFSHSLPVSKFVNQLSWSDVSVKQCWQSTSTYIKFHPQADFDSLQ